MAWASAQGRLCMLCGAAQELTPWLRGFDHITESAPDHSCELRLGQFAVGLLVARIGRLWCRVFQSSSRMEY